MSEMAEFSQGIIVGALTYGATIYCARCDGRYIAYEPSREHAVTWGMPLTTDIPTWREYLTRLGWTEDGTVCISCSEPATTVALGRAQALCGQPGGSAGEG